MAGPSGPSSHPRCFILHDTDQTRDDYVRRRMSDKGLRRRDDDNEAYYSHNLMPWARCEHDEIVSEEEGQIYAATMGYYDNIFHFFMENERLILANSPDTELELALADDLWNLKMMVDERHKRGIYSEAELDSAYKGPIRDKVHLLALSSAKHLYLKPPNSKSLSRWTCGT